jgi:TRAP transporter TAXI family solute receptor
MPKRRWLLIGLTAGLSAVFMACRSQSSIPAAHERVTITLAAGHAGGIYLKLGNTMAERARKEGIELQVLETQGSEANVGLLASDKAQVALVQKDVYHRTNLGLGPVRSLKDQLVGIPLYQEMVQILVRPHSYLRNSNDLRDRNVSVGPKGSGAFSCARAVLNASGVGPKGATELNLDAQGAEEGLQGDDLDAAFFTGAVPQPEVKEIIRKNPEIHLLPLDSRVIERLVKDESFVHADVPKSAYPNDQEEVPTVAVEALLVTRQKSAGAWWYLALQNILKEQRKGIESAASVELSLLPDNPLPHRLTFLTLLLGSAWLGVMAYKKRSRLRNVMEGREALVLNVMVFVFLWVACSAGLYWSEHKFNENFESFLQSVWSMMIYVAGGLEAKDRSPMTPSGEVFGVLSVVFGVATIAWFTAEFANHLVRREIDKVRKLLGRKIEMPRDIQDHIVLVNWNQHAQEIIRQFRLQKPDDRRPIVVLSEVENRLHDPRGFEGVTFLTGVPAEIEFLRTARVEHARSVTIVSAWQSADPNDRRTMDADLADSKTMLTVLAIRNLCAEHKHSVPITAEIRSRRNVSATERAGHGGPIEIVCLEDFGVDVLAQCALTPGLASFYNHILNFSADNNQIQQTHIPDWLVGKVFSEVLRHFAERRGENNFTTLPIGLYRSSTLYVNPSDEELGLLRKDDLLFVIRAASKRAEALRLSHAS